MKKTVSAYLEDGVNVPLGDQLSAFSGNLCKQTYGNSPHVIVREFSDGFFRGPKGYAIVDLPPGSILYAGVDGEGTKPIITDAAGMHRMSARNWVAMCAGDNSRYGGKTLILTNQLDVSSLGENSDSPAFKAACELMLGLKDAADECDYVMYTGETAEMGPCVGSENENATLKYIWGGSALGVLNPKNMITGKDVRVGQIVMAMHEPGLGANGGSSARKGFARKFGSDWFSHPDAQEYIKKAAVPCKLYDKFFAHLNGWSSNDLIPLVKTHLNVHLTGGAFEGKFFEDFLKRHGLSAELDRLYTPPEIAQCCGEWRGIGSEEFYRTFNGGQRVLAVIDSCDEQKFVAHAKGFQLETRKCGEICKATDKPRLTIHSKFEENTVIHYC